MHFFHVLRLLKTEHCKLLCGINLIKYRKCSVLICLSMDLTLGGCSVETNDNWGREQVSVSLRREAWEQAWPHVNRKYFKFTKSQSIFGHPYLVIIIANDKLTNSWWKERKRGNSTAHHWETVSSSHEFFLLFINIG